MHKEKVFSSKFWFLMQLGLGTFALQATPTRAAPPESPPVQIQPEGKSSDPQLSTLASATPAEQRTPPLVPAMAQEFSGLAWGSFLAYPELNLAATYDDNIYGQPRNVVDDGVLTISSSLQLRSRWDRHALNFDVGADFDRYLNHYQENVNDYWAGFDGRYDLNAGNNIFGGARFSHDHEDRSSPNALTATQQKEPTLFDHGETHLGFSGNFGNFLIRAGGTYDVYDFKDGSSDAVSNVDNDFRDRSMSSLGIRASYAVSPNHEFFAQYATDRRNYENSISSIAPYNRDSDGYRLAAGVKFRLPQQALAGEIFAGTMQQDFDHTGFSDVSKPYFGAVVNWRPNSLLRVTGFIDRSLEETTIFLPGTAAPGDETYASSSLDTTYGFEVERKLTGKLSVNGRAAYTQSAYQGIDRIDNIIDAGAGLRYYVTPVVFVGADLRVINRDSDDPLAMYSRNQLMLNIGYTPARNRDYAIIPEETATPDVSGTNEIFSGFYLGAQLGQGGLTTATKGARGGGGFDEGDMGNIGESYGLFAGWGKEIDDLYFGVELDANESNARWYHSKDKDDSRTMHVDKNFGYGLSARAGYKLDGGMLYGKLGLVRTNFDTYYTENQYAATGAYNKEQDKNGIRWGLGVEIPASSNLFVRMDYSYTDYGKYDAPYQSGDAPLTYSTEEFDTGDSVFSVGLGWRFDDNRPVTAKRPASELRGFYAGASLGHGTLATQLTGTQMDAGGAEGPFDFYGEFASHGFTGGFFAGYGTTFNRFYLGLELDAEAANFGWYHERQTGGDGGRDFSVEKRAGYGARLRLGYALDNGGLLYGHIGPVSTRFNTIYEKGAGESHWIDRVDRRLDGTRIGIGAEFPASRNTFVRMDYSYTQYGSYGFVTTHNGGLNPDDMSFENRESLARLGLGFRF